jgi:uncharacterized protein with HEPN domain
MTQHDDNVSLRQMLDHAREATELIGGRVRADLDRDRVLELALTRLVEIVGEAARRVSPDCRAQHPEIPWTQIIGLRNRLTHGYDTINLDILWQIVASDWPELVRSLELIVGPAGG